MKKKISVYIMVMLSVMLITACGASEEKLEELSAKQEEAANLKTQAEELYGSITDSSYREGLDDINAREEEFNAQDYTKKSDKKIDEEVLPVIDEIIEEYTSVNSEMAEVKAKEDQERAEADNYVYVSCIITNNVGSDISSIVLKDEDKVYESSNYIKEEQVLATGQMMTGIVLEIYKPSTNRSLVVTLSDGTVVEYSLSDFDADNYSEKCAVITLGDMSEQSITIE
ncbi:MAG: hypothetical protein K6B41_06330 [Butyrivibrio sp.]|nr:hypothetical protein [Butyrivibrio sp.]